MTYTNEQLEKIKLIDALFESIDISDLKEFADSERIVGKLKGKEVCRTPVMNLILQNQELKDRLATLHIEVQSLQFDIQMLTRLILKPYDYNSAADVQTLKTRCGIY